MDYGGIMKDFCKVVSMFVTGAILAVVVDGCTDEQDESSRVVVSVEKSGGMEMFREKCSLVAKQMETRDMSLLDFNDKANEELAVFVGEIPQLVELNDERKLLTIQLSGGFCHKGLIVKVSGGNLSEDETRRAAQVADTWRRIRMAESVFWYTE